VEDLVASLPPYLKYVVLTVVPWIELRGSVPWAVQQGDRLYMPIILLANIAVFFPTYFILQWVYQHIPEGSWLRRKLEHARDRARPLVDKYGLLGLTIFVAVPLPGTGAYAGSAAAIPNRGSEPMFVGVWNAEGAQYWGYGLIDELRISKGIARWTANFTVPTSPY